MLPSSDTSADRRDSNYVREANRADLPDLLAMGYALYEVEKQFEPLMTFSKEEAQERYDRQIDDPNCLFLILEVKQKIAGYLYAHLDPSEDMQTTQPECEIEVIFLKPESRGSGLAALLLTEALQWAKQKQAWRVKTGIFAQNMASLKTFDRLGFQDHHITKVFEI